MSGGAPAGATPALTLPDNLSEAATLLRPVLEAGTQPGAVVLLLDIEAQGVEG